MADVSSLNGGRSLRCLKDRVFLFQLDFEKETEQEIVVGKTVFGYWQQSAHRHKIQIATTACALETMTRKGEMFSKTLFLKNTVQNDN